MIIRFLSSAAMCSFIQALLLLCHMGVVYGHCLRLFWSGTTSGAAKTHIRVILLLKSFSFAFSALQLRSGYPSPASYRYDHHRIHACCLLAVYLELPLSVCLASPSTISFHSLSMVCVQLFMSI